jgi:hypothetical protein
MSGFGSTLALVARTLREVAKMNREFTILAVRRYGEMLADEEV